MKILVTGAAGFIGSNLVLRLLERGDTVVGIDNHNDYYDPAIKEARLARHLNHPRHGNYTHLRIDLADRDAVASAFATHQPQRVVNLAAQAGVRYSITNPLAYIDSNIVGFAHILEGCRHNAVEHLVYTVKPNVYGSIAARALGIPVVNNISGLGAVFMKETWLTCLVRGLYRLALSRSARVFFQNEDDRRLFVEGKLVRQEVTDMVPGSGVALAHFEATPLPATTHAIRFLLIARMLWDKGVGEFVEAARMIKSRGAHAEFCLLGFLDVQNPATVLREEMQAWVDESVVKYLGATDDVRPYIAEADCIVLPSYREGTPRSLLEAAAMARPIITTDAVGCREVVHDGVSGYLCHTRDAADLAEKMQRMIALSPEARAEMGRRGREKVERQFDEEIVINKYLETIAEIVGQPPHVA